MRAQKSHLAVAFFMECSPHGEQEASHGFQCIIECFARAHDGL